MGLSPYSILKVLLWLQAISLLVLISLLADSSAWIGTILTATGFCFVVIGIGAAHKQSLGYLYSYATLVGVWSLLAIVHVVIICGLITIPEEVMRSVLLLGQKIVNGESDAMRTIVPALYAVQGIAWCMSLVCLVYLRVAMEECPFQDVETQSPMARSLAHTMEAQSNTEDYRGGNRISQRFFGFRPSVVAPHETSTEPSRTMILDMAKGPMTKHHEHMATPYDILEPSETWTEDEKRVSHDSSTIYFPKDRRISQVVVTFMDDDVDAQGPQHQQLAESLIEPMHMTTSDCVIEARTTLIDNINFGLDNMIFDKPNESLTDMIFKAVQPLQTESPSKNEVASRIYAKEHSMGANKDSDQKDLEFKAISITSFATTALSRIGMAHDDSLDCDHRQDRAVEDLARSISKESTSDIPKDRIAQLEQLRQQQQHNQNVLQSLTDQGQELELFSVVSTKHQPSFPVAPVRRSSFSHSFSTLTQRLDMIGEEDSDADVEKDANDSYEYSKHFHMVPSMQPNSTGSHPFSHDMEETRVPEQDATSADGDFLYGAPTTSIEAIQFNTPPLPPPRTKTSITSVPIQDWRNCNSNNNSAITDSLSNNTLNPVPSLAFNLANTFSIKEKQQPTMSSTLASEPTRTIIIPTIVLHPDEEDDEPARVLSDMEIEYLSTMPPTPLRLLIQPWEEFDDEYYDGEGHDSYDYDDYHNDFDQHDEDDGVPEQDQEWGGKACGDMEYDPYAFDVPINLEIDLQVLDNTYTKTTATYGYI
ncbi:hypothetical protein BG011_006275 [Mortierella polycephala]|uniref:Uncharacterized protein n=1 Tax=Mortierella polycephala TaxID=41804 RepID=A0A9P6U998_9FUNG|nr:hypothetical protein BG011_006275 [Mortierella polycephala]